MPLAVNPATMLQVEEQRPATVVVRAEKDLRDQLLLRYRQRPAGASTESVTAKCLQCS